MSFSKISRVVLGFLFGLAALAASAPLSAACRPSGVACGVSSAANDRLCCPGLVCGWGNVCQAGCRINGTFYRNGVKNPGNACQSCQPSRSTTSWSAVQNGATCSDANACTATDRCQAGQCVGTPVTCTSDQCNTRSCNGTSTCTVTPRANGTACNDATACTYNDVCTGGSCGGTPVTCTSDQCNTRTCNGTASCTVTPRSNGTACNDATACTYGDVCTGGTCGGTPIVCANDQCNTRACNGSSTCTVTPRASGTACNDANACTYTDVCTGGSCGGTPIVCANDQCNTRACNGSSTCTVTPRGNGTPCNDANACTYGDACDVGSCDGTPIVCADDQCNTRACNGTPTCTVTPRSNGTPCDDANACTYGDACDVGSCDGTPIVCTDDACNTQTCDGTSTCSVTPRPDGTTCDAGGSCGPVRVCVSGTCTDCSTIPTDSGTEFVDNGDGTVTDRSTCLVWEKKTGTWINSPTSCNGPGGCPDARDVNNVYGWSTCGDPTCPPDGAAFTDFLARLNAGVFAGRQDWRLPSSGGRPSDLPSGKPAELESILAPSCPGYPLACIDPVFGPTVPAGYWSSTPWSLDPAGAWRVSFGDAFVGIDGKSTSVQAVRAVRSGSCQNQVRDCGEGAVDCGGTCAPCYTADGTIPFLWEDISSSGNLLPLRDDEVSAAIPIGFTFDYYGEPFSSLHVGSNGFLTVLPGQLAGCCDGQPIPTAGSPDGMIAGWWVDLNPDTGGSIRYQTLGVPGSGVFIVQFTSVPHFFSNNSVTFQFKLFEATNVIEVHYLNAAASSGYTHSAGVENLDGTDGVEYFHGAGPLPASSAVGYSPP